jgi:long-chain fatty acid transport protein
MKFAYLTTLGALALSTTAAHSGGWETGKLDTGFLYEDDNYLELSYGSLNYSVNGTTQASVTHPMAKDQTRTSFSGKFQLGNFDIGLTSFGSGAIQMDGQNPAATGSVVPSADVNLDTQAIMARYSLNDNWSATVGLRQAQLKASTVTTPAATYNIDAASETGMVYGIAYEIPTYALKVEILRSEAMALGLTGEMDYSSTSFALSNTSILNIPEATTVKIQTGIAENTLLMMSAHRVNWGSSQIAVDNPVSALLNLESEFENTTSYSLGLGRKLSERTAVSITYSWEDGSDATPTSPFSMSNGSKTLSVGVKHSIDALTISAGASYTKVGDALMTHSSGAFASYADNSVTALGLKVGYNF